MIQRIEDTVRDPKVRAEMVHEVEQGESLDLVESRKVYPFTRERGSFFRSFSMVPHAAYRMDWRGITVKDVIGALDSFAAAMKALKAKNQRQYEDTLMQDKIEWVDPKTRLQIVFGVDREGSASIISAYWKGKPDPEPTVCDLSRRLAARYEAMSQGQ